MLAAVGELSPKARGGLAGRGDLFVKRIPAKGKLKKNDLLSQSGCCCLQCTAVHTWSCICCPGEYIVEGTLGLSYCI